MHRLTDDERRVLRAVAAGKGSAALYETTAEDPSLLGDVLIPDGLMLSRPDADAIAGAEVVAGLLAGEWPWLVEFAGAVTLTPLGAARMRVVIVELAAPRWGWEDAEKAEAEPRSPWVDRHMHGYGLPCPELVPDHRPGPAEEVAYLEDRWTGEPVILFGRPVPIDRRMGRAG